MRLKIPCRSKDTGNRVLKSSCGNIDAGNGDLIISCRKIESGYTGGERFPAMTRLQVTGG